MNLIWCACSPRSMIRLRACWVVHSPVGCARAASDNAASLRVLQKCGFKAVGAEKSFAAGRNEDIEETILRLET
jgi:RimJ/RimL family protein N-acetyltransferase